MIHTPFVRLQDGGFINLLEIRRACQNEDGTELDVFYAGIGAGEEFDTFTGTNKDAIESGLIQLSLNREPLPLNDGPDPFADAYPGANTGESGTPDNGQPAQESNEVEIPF